MSLHKAIRILNSSKITVFDKLIVLPLDRAIDKKTGEAIEYLCTECQYHHTFQS